MFETIILFDNLCVAWREFVRGKKLKKDIAEFSLDLFHNLFVLHEDLKNKTYKHGAYKAFGISDPKPRLIHKSSVRDRVLHHAIHRVLYPYFDKKFIYDSYSCRQDKGTHRAINRLRAFGRKVSKNNTRTCWILKCDIEKFFANIDHAILVDILRKHISEPDIMWLLKKVIESFSVNPGVGLPLGNLTSQLFVNIYMNEFDQFAKHKLKAKFYIRYADDFVFFSEDKKWLENLVPIIRKFLSMKLKLQLHPDKLFLKTLASGVDFLGWVHFLHHRVLRTATKHRMFKRTKEYPRLGALASYEGLLRYGNTYKLQLKLEKNLLN